MHGPVQVLAGQGHIREVLQAAPRQEALEQQERFGRPREEHDRQTEGNL